MLSVIIAMALCWEAVPFLAGCCDNDETPATFLSHTATSTSTPVAPTPEPLAKVKGMLTVALPWIATVKELTSIVRGEALVRTIYQTMVDYVAFSKRDRARCIPGLPEEWMVSDDGMSITLLSRGKGCSSTTFRGRYLLRT